MTKKFNKASYAVFEQACTTLNLNPSRLSVELGYSDNAAGGWKKKNVIPQVAALAIECLLRRKNLQDKGTCTLVIKTGNSQLKAIKEILKTLGCTFVEV